MNIVCIGGGPAGLYFGILMKKADPAHDITVIERNRADDTFGFGVVFSDATLGNLAEADLASYAAISGQFAHWDDIDTHIGGRVLRSTGHGFCGLERKTLLEILQRRCKELGVRLHFETDVADVAEFADADLIVAADGVASRVRDSLSEYFEPDIDVRPNKFVWLGTTFPFGAFTFYFKESEHGLFRVHAYRYQDSGSTFIVECTGDTWRRAGLEAVSEDDSIAYLENVFESELDGHHLIKNRSIWRSFPTIRNKRWHHGNVVLVGDAAHTAHFSIGSGTKLAMEDCIHLASALDSALAGRARLSPDELTAALSEYEASRRPVVESLQRAAQVSLEWFETTERYMKLAPEQFAFSLLTRSLRVSHENLKMRDPEFVAEVDRFYAEEALAQCGLSDSAELAQVVEIEAHRSPLPPMFTPFKVADYILPNRVVGASPAQGQASDGVVGDWHLMHLGSLAVGGCGVVLTEPVAVSPDGRRTPRSAGLYSEACRDGFARVVDFIHRHSRSRAGVLLSHAGRRGAVSQVAASAIPYGPDTPVPRAATRDDIGRIVADFSAATTRADAGGFDLLCLDIAGGTLLAGFLSPLTNQRDDEYGGSLANRLRFPLEVIAAVRRAWPAQKPLTVKLSVTDWAAGGLSADSAVTIAAALKEAGCDIVGVTTGDNVVDQVVPTGKLVDMRFADRIRNEVDIPTMAAGGIAAYADVNSILAAGRADLCVLQRVLLYDPHFCRRAAHEQDVDLAWPEPYALARDFVPRSPH
ncbi:MAG: FAD-dependent monooxygenase [Proteobacteria bacterium]|nr:FAD-dependent monooxygenase [Pseudomonadota bacterium]